MAGVVGLFGVFAVDFPGGYVDPRHPTVTALLLARDLGELLNSAEEVDAAAGDDALVESLCSWNERHFVAALTTAMLRGETVTHDLAWKLIGERSLHLQPSVVQFWVDSLESTFREAADDILLSGE